MNAKVFVYISSVILTFLIPIYGFAEQLVSGSDMINYAQKHLINYLGNDYSKDNVEIIAVHPLQDVKLPDGKITMGIDNNEMASIGKYYTLPLTLSVNDKPLKTIYINLKTKLFETVVIAQRTIKMHQILNEDDLNVARIELGGNSSGLFKNVQDLIGMKTAQYIQAGKPITADNITRTPIVNKNKQLKVIGKIGNIEATIYGIAQENGFINDVIKIQNPSTQKMITARIIDKESAELIF